MANKILVVDDEPGFVELVTGILTARGYAVSSAADGLQALDSISKNAPDLILLDIKMPKMSGYDVCKLLRNDERLRDIPVIMLTALGELDNIKTGMSLGAVSYISKPFEQNKLLSMIQALIGPGSPGPADQAKDAF